MKLRYLAAGTILLIANTAFAGVDKVYGPNVEPGEIELELRGLYIDDNDPSRNGTQKSKIGIGHSIAPRVFVEGYLVFEKATNAGYELEAFEIEARFQLSEQGEYFADFGLLTELEKVREADEWEFKVGPLIQKPIGNSLVTVNLLGETKFGSDVSESGEWELLSRVQLKYLSSPRFEPGLEYYGDEGTQAFGPAVYGRIDLPGPKILWQAGWMFGLDDATADNTIRWQVEWEF